MKNPHDLGFFHSYRHAFRHCGRCRQALRLSDEASLAQEFVRPQDGDDGFLPMLGDDGDFDFDFLDIEY